MAFGFGGSKSESKSKGQSTSMDFATSGSVSGGVSAAGSDARATSFGRQRAGSESQQRVAFEDIFARLFGGAEGAAAGLDPSLLTDAANQLFSGGIDFLDTLSGGADTEFLQNRISGNDALLDEQISGLGEDIGAFFREQVLPGISSEAIAGGSLGGSRQGVAEGAAAEAAGREFGRGATALRSADAAQRIDAAGVLGQSRIAGAEAGLGGLGGLAGIADFGFGADLEPFERLSALLGGPTVLGEASSVSSGDSGSESISSSFSSAEDFARAFSLSFGQSQATNESSSSSIAANIGVD